MKSAGIFNPIWSINLRTTSSVELQISAAGLKLTIYRSSSRNLFSLLSGMLSFTIQPKTTVQFSSWSTLFEKFSCCSNVFASVLLCILVWISACRCCLKILHTSVIDIIPGCCLLALYTSSYFANFMISFGFTCSWRITIFERTLLPCRQIAVHTRVLQLTDFPCRD